MRVTDDCVFFWTGNDIYSKIHFAPFTHDGKEFGWVEQAILYKKAKLFGADDIASAILQQTNPMFCRELGKSEKINYDESIWIENSERIYKEVLVDKFSQPVFKNQILETDSRKFVEVLYEQKRVMTKGDSVEDIMKNNIDDKETNLLGIALGEVRELLKSN